ncbi:MAG: DUF1801 domain-containing protein [Akkermansiaceae bacterium]|nr:DUF1801 domain-containing protein [Akkermansiaceae bacterium]
MAQLRRTCMRVFGISRGCSCVPPSTSSMAILLYSWRKPSNSMLGVPVWSHNGIICTGETYKDKVKLTFARGAALADPSGLFNSSLDGNVRRAIDISEGDTIDEKALRALVRAAVALNTAKRAAVRPARAAKKAKRG